MTFAASSSNKSRNELAARLIVGKPITWPLRDGVLKLIRENKRLLELVEDLSAELSERDESECEGGYE